MGTDEVLEHVAVDTVARLVSVELDAGVIFEHVVVDIVVLLDSVELDANVVPEHVVVHTVAQLDSVELETDVALEHVVVAPRYGPTPQGWMTTWCSSTSWWTP